MSDKGRIPVILDGARTPIGRFLGGLSPLSATELGAVALSAAIERSGIDGDAVEEVIMGNVVTAGEGQAPARQAAIHAGIPATVPSVTINKVCGSGLKAVMLAAQSIRAGDAHVVVAGGMESMSNVPLLPAGCPLRREIRRSEGRGRAHSGRPVVLVRAVSHGRARRVYGHQGGGDATRSGRVRVSLAYIGCCSDGYR